MKFENTWVGNFQGAIRGMRNPKNSWNKMDSYFGAINNQQYREVEDIAEKWVQMYYPDQTIEKEWSEENAQLHDNFINRLLDNGILKNNEENECADAAFIGPADMKLAQTLIKAGSEHRKFLRQIFVSVDITAPLYWWKELDTYKVATVANSTSTMHKLTSKEITLDCFETDDFNPNMIYYSEPSLYGEVSNTTGMLSELIIEQVEFLRLKYLATNDKRYWKELVRWLPEGWLQKRTWTANYETLRAICSVSQRRNHKLNEWSGKDDPTKPNFIQWARTLPYAQYFIFDDEDKEFHIF